jgi:hypothetical protein
MWQLYIYVFIRESNNMKVHKEAKNKTGTVFQIT